MGNTPDEIGVGIIGVGISGRTMARAFSSTPSARVVAMAGRTPGRAQKIAARFESEAEPDAEALVARQDVDLVVVGTPQSQHLEGVKLAVGAGKAVLCEKPFASNAREAKEMLDLVNEAGIPNFVNFEFRRFGARARAKALVDEGFVGQINTVFLFGSSDYLKIAGEYVPPWHLDAGQGGGWLAASGTHDVDALRTFAGEIASLSAALPNIVHELVLRGSDRPVPNDSDDAAMILLRFASGATGVMANTSASATPTLGQRIEIHGDEGTLILQTRTMSGGPLADAAELWGARSGEGELQLLEVPPPLIVDDDPHTGPQLQWVHEIVQSLRAGTALEPNFEDGWRNQLVLDAARLADVERRWVSTDEIEAALGAN
jgi:predicted dehydrogenase